MKTDELPKIGMIDGRFCRVEIKVVDLGPQDAIIQRMSAELPVNMPSAFMLPGGKPAHIQTKSGSIIVWTELDRVRLSTVYTVARDGTRYPVFKKPEQMQSPPEHEAAFEWEPKLAMMRLFIVSVLKWMDHEKQYQWAVSYLIAKAPKRKEIFRPPIPNTYSDGKICMGSGYTATGPCLADVFCHNLAHFDSSKWNSDLADGVTADNAKAMFSFDRDNKQIAPPKDYKWWESTGAPPCNNLNYGELPLV